MATKECKKCGNPKIMYWCSDCEQNSEYKECEDCGGKTKIDKEYHKECDVKHTNMDKLKDALNRLDEWASLAIADNDNGEAHQQAKDYNLLFDFLNGKQAIKVDLSEEDLEDLQNGETFDWTFPTKAGQDIDIHLYKN